MGIYLYEAMIEVLRAGRNIPMTIEDITDSIINQGLYLKTMDYHPMFDVLVKLRDKHL